MQTAFITNNQSTTIVEPGEAALDAPSFAVAFGRKSRRRAEFAAFGIFSGRNAAFDAALPQLAPKRGAVEAFVGNKLLHSGAGPPAFLLFDGDARQSATSQRHFMRSGAFTMQTDRQTVAVGHQHHFAAFPDLGAADSIAPFFDGTNEPSRKAAAHSILPSRSSVEGEVRQIRLRTPARNRSSKRRRRGRRRTALGRQISPRNAGFQNILFSRCVFLLKSFECCYRRNRCDFSLK